jgi:mannose-6-phosphate isomerase-like protein (cupin superfamily)
MCKMAPEPSRRQGRKLEAWMRIVRNRSFTGGRAWEALDIERFSGEVTVRLHWTDRPYVWHVNDGPEVFAVLDGRVEMRTRGPEGEEAFLLEAGDVFHAGAGDEHVAHPVGEARILVVERAGSI